MPRVSSDMFLPFRQRAPFAGMFVAACLGILASDRNPEWWPYWAAGFLLTVPAVCKKGSSWLALILAFAIFGFWHGNQVAADQGYQRSREDPFDGKEHAVTLVILSRPISRSPPSVPENPSPMAIASQRRENSRFPTNR